MKQYRIGQIVNTHGLRGEVKVYLYTDYPERFDEIDYLYIQNREEKYYIDKARYQNNMVILKIKGIDTIEKAEGLRGLNLYIDEGNIRELDEDEYMIADLIGLDVYLMSGAFFGKLENVLQYSANDIYVIRSEEGKEYLVPAIKEFVPVIDIDNRKIIVEPIRGLLE